MSKMLTAENVAFMSMLVALVAVVIGPIVTLMVAKRQIVSPIRQKWIDELRELLSEILSESKRAVVDSRGDGLLNSEQHDDGLFKRLLYLEQKLRLMLNPQESDHVALIELVNSLTDEAHHGVKDIVKFGEVIAETTALSQRILKSEWKRVKSGGA